MANKNNVNVSVSLNAAAFQAGAQQFTASVNQMQGAVNTFANSLNTTQQQINQLITVVNQLAQANQHAGHGFGAYLGANLAADAIRDFTQSLKELLIESTLYAARTEELGVSLQAIAKATNSNLQVIAQQEFAMKKLNITTQDARNVLTKFLQADLDLNKSGALARTAQDLAVIAGVSTSEEINKLIIGIQTLQSRNLRTAGVFLTVDEVLDRLAKTSHRARDSFSTFEKQQAVLNAVLEFGARVTGTYEAAMETASKQIRSMERLIFEAQNAIGQFFVPVLGLAVKALSEMFIWIESHPRTFLLLAAAVTAVAASFLLLNTRLGQTLRQTVALTTVGFVRMIASLRILPVNVAAATASIEGFTGATVAATAGITGFELALGGITAALGIIGLIVGLTAAFTDAAMASEDLAKVTDSGILSIGASTKAYKEQIEVVKTYNQIAQQTAANPAILEQIQAVQDLLKEQSDTKAFELSVKSTQDAVAQLNAELDGLNQKVQDIQKSDPSGLLRFQELSQTNTRIKDTTASIQAQSEALETYKSQLEGAQQNQRTTTERLEQLQAVTGLSADKAYDLAKATEAYKKTIENLTPEQKIELEITHDLIKANEILIEQKLRLAGVYIYTTTKNLEQVQKEIDKINQQIDAQQRAAAVQLENAQKPLPGDTQVRPLQFRRRSAEEIAADDARDTQRLEQLRTQRIQNVAEAGAKEAADLILQRTSLEGKQREFIRTQDLIIEQTGKTTHELAEAALQYRGTKAQVDAYAAALDNVRAQAQKFREEAKESTLSLSPLRKAIEEITIKPLQPGGVDVLSQKLKGVKSLVDTFSEFTGEPGKFDFEKLLGDPKAFEQFVQLGRDSGRELQDVINKQFGGDIPKALQESLAKINVADKGGLQKFVEAWLAALRNIKEEAQDANARVRDEMEKMRKSLETTESQINSFLHPNSPEFALRIKLEDAERTKKDLEAIFTLRHRLGIPLDIPIKRENVQRTRQELEVLAKVFDEVRDANNAILTARLGAGAPIVNVQVRAETALLKLVRERRNEEKQIAADIATSINKRIQLETQAGNVQRIQARAFLDVLNEEQQAREGLITAVTRLQISRGDFSFADQNEIIKKGLQAANDPVVSSINDTNKTIADSTQKILETQVDFGKAIGDKVSGSTDVLASQLKDSNVVLRNHASLQQTTNSLLEQIRDNINPQDPNTIDYGNSVPAYGYGGPGSSTVHGIRFGKSDLRSLVVGEAARRGIPTDVALAQFRQESSFNNNAVSPKGAQGPAQFLPSTFARFGPKGGNPFDPEDAVEAWGNYMSFLLKKFKGHMDLALAAYNAGEGAVDKFNGQIPPYKETQDYVRNILGRSMSAFEYATQKAKKTEPKESTVGGIDITQGLKAVGKFLTDFGNFRDALKGSSPIFKALNIPVTPENAQRFTQDPNAIGAASKFAKDIENRETEIKQRRILLELQEYNIDNLANLRSAELVLDRQQERLNQFLKVQVDNVIELKNAEEDLLRLRTDSLTIAEELHQAALARIQAEQEAQREATRTVEEQRYRSNPVNRRREEAVLLQKEFTERLKAEQELDDRLAVLQAKSVANYSHSEDFRRRVAKESQAQRLQLEEDLNRRIFELDEDLLHHTETHAQEYAIAWREALLDVKNRHAEAIKTILRNQAGLLDQNVLDTAKVRAKVLDSVNQVEGISESVGGLFNDTFKVYADDIDRWIDKTTDQMGNLGKIFNGFLKSISHRAIGNIESSILDAIFPPTPEEQAAKQGVKTGGVDPAETSFRKLEESTLALGNVELKTAQITIDTASSLNGLTRAAAVASDALIQIGSIVAGISAQSGGTSGTGALSGLLNTSLGGGGSTGSGSLPSLARAISGIGFGGLGASPQSAGANALQGAFSKVPSLSFGGSGVPSSVTALLEKVRNQPLSTSIGPLATLSGSSGGGLKGILSGALGGTKNGILSLFSKAGLKNLGAGLGPQLPFLGLGLGLSLGGPSKLGGILGGAGGLLLGGSSLALLAPLLGIGGTAAGAGGAIGAAAGGALGGGSLFGTLAPLLTNPFTIAAGVALLAGAYILGKNKLRRQEETTRDQLGGDLRSKLYQILADVKSDKLQGTTGVQQAQQLIEEYRQQVQQFKDKKTREHALGFINDVQPIVQQIELAARAQVRKQEFESKLIPTYAYGGVAESSVIRVSKQERLEFPSGSKYTIPGKFDGMDDILAFVPRGTKIRSPHPQAVYPYATGGIAGIAPINRSSRSTRTPIQVTAIVVMSDKEAQELAKKIPNSMIADKASMDAKLRPNGLPAAIEQALSGGY